jgi:hypothetical protein
MPDAIRNHASTRCETWLQQRLVAAAIVVIA